MHPVRTMLPLLLTQLVELVSRCLTPDLEKRIEPAQPVALPFFSCLG